jgi:putative membrane protein
MAEGGVTQGPVLFDLEDADARADPAPHVADAPPVPDIAPAGGGPQVTAMQAAIRAAARPASRLSRWFWRVTLALVTALAGIAAWDFAVSLVARVPVLGWTVTGLLGAFVFLLLLLALREVAALVRLGRVDELRRAAENARDLSDLEAARAVVGRLDRLYAGRADTAWGRARLAERKADVFEAADLLGLAEDTLLAPLDAAAQREVEAAARQVAAVTALVPLALADVAAALAANLRMIRRVAEIYGGRGGVIGSWRLTRAVFAHLVATGAVAVGDDLLEPILGGSILSRVSRRFGEGVVNGALSARVGVAAIEVCRPLPFSQGRRPSVRGLVKRALGGLFFSGSDKTATDGDKSTTSASQTEKGEIG